MTYIPNDPFDTQRAATPDGVTITICEWGNSAGKPIVFIHGVSQSMLSFAPQFNDPTLAAEFRLIAWDLRGHGDSDKPAEPKFYAEGRRWADELATVIEATKARSPVVVGWSMGGRVLAQYLQHNGDARLGAINFVSARVLAEPRFSGSGILKPASGGATGLGRRILQAEAFLSACFQQVPPADEMRFALAYNLATPPHVLDAIPLLPADLADTRAALNAVQVPCVVSHGARDNVVLPDCAREVAALVPDARLSIFEEAGHSPFREDASRFNHELATLARSVDGNQRGQLDADV